MCSQKVNWKIQRNSSFEKQSKEICSTTSNILIQSCWSSLETFENTDLNTYQGFLFLFFKLLSLVISMNISKIKHHSYETLNLQVCLIILVLTHENLWFWAIFCKEKVIFITGMSFFLFLTHGNEFLSMFWTINACRIRN